MDVRQCKRCRKIFNYTGNPLCHRCVQESDREFTEVRNYIYETPQASLEMVCEATGVDPNDVRRWLKEGRLILHKGGAALINCEKCGAPILTGRLCAQCVSAVQNELSGAAQTLRPRPEPERQSSKSSKEKMHTNIRRPL